MADETRSADRKTWKTSLNAQAGMTITEDSAIIQGDKKNFVASTPEGNYISGKVSFISAPSDIRIAGMWTFNDSLTSTLPSTIVTPMPVLRMSPPVEGLVQMQEVVSLLSMLL